MPTMTLSQAQADIQNVITSLQAGNPTDQPTLDLIARLQLELALTTSDQFTLLGMEVWLKPLITFLSGDGEPLAPSMEMVKLNIETANAGLKIHAAVIAETTPPTFDIQQN